MHKQDVIIIGGGLGGLISAAMLSKEGLKVTVLEKNAKLGGGLQSFTRNGAVFDTDMHIVTGMSQNGSIYRILKYLGIIDELEITSNDSECSDIIYVNDDKAVYKLASGKEGFIKSITSYFPNSKEEISNYIKAIESLTHEMDIFYLKRPRHNILEHNDDFFIPVSEFIAKYIKDKKLQNLLAYCNILYAGKKDVTPAYIHAVLSTLLLNGSSRFKGGTCRFVATLARLIKRNGGQIITGDGVKEIVTEGNTIIKVVTDSGKSFCAHKYISSIHPAMTLDLLSDKKVISKSYAKLLQETKDSDSAFIINIKLKENKIPYIKNTIYLLEDYASVWKHNEERLNKLMLLTPPCSNQGEYASTMCITIPMTWSMVKKWEDSKLGNREQSYYEWKSSVVREVLNYIRPIFPDLEDAIELIDTSSPLTIRDYTGVRHGAMCGYQKDYNNFIINQIPIRTRVNNLLLTGQNINIHGFCGVILTALMTCEEILGGNYLIDKLNHEV